MSTLEQNAQSIAFAAQHLQGAPAPLLIALDGRCAAGKTTLANRLAEQYGWGVIHLDDFFCSPPSARRSGWPSRAATWTGSG